MIAHTSTSPAPTCADLLAGRSDHVLLTLADWASVLPGRRRGRSLDARTLLRWVLAGCRGHRLRSRRIGQRHVVIGLHLRAFLAAIAPADVAAPSAPTHRGQARRARAARQAAARALGMEKS